MPTTILGLAHHLPPNQEAAGVRRPIFAEPGGPSDLVLPAARQVLAQAGVGADQVDFLIFATMTPDVTFPGAACFLQHKLECGTAGALDIRGQCSGFLMGLMLADSFLAAGTYRRILLAAAEVHSSGLDYSEDGARVAALYGDGAAALILGEGSTGLDAVVCHADGRHYERFWCEYPASRQHPVRMTIENFREGRHFPALDFAFVAQFGREHLPVVVNEALSRSGTRADGIDAFILSHILPEVIESSAKSLSIPPAKLIDAGERHGHLTAATLPVALSEAVTSGRLGKGARVCLATCGAGFTWAAAVMTL